MANKRITALSNFDGDRWSTPVPIGAEAANIDVPVNDHTTPGTTTYASLQSIIGTRNDNDDPIATQISTLKTNGNSYNTRITAIETIIGRFTNINAEMIDLDGTSPS